MYERMDGWINGLTDGWISRWEDGLINRWADRQIDSDSNMASELGKAG